MDLAFSISAQAGLYGLLALSIALVFGTSRIVNLALGDFAAVGAYVMVATAGLDFGLRVLIAVAVTAPVFFLLERLVLRRVNDGLTGILVTIAIGIAIRQTLELVFSSTPRSVPVPVDSSVELLGAVYPTYRLIAAGVGLAVVVVALVVCYSTRAGLWVRAASENAPMAALMGVRPGMVRSLAFVVAGSLAVLAGALYSPILGVGTTMGFALLVPPFVALLLVRPGAFRTTVVVVVVVVAVQVILRRFYADSVADALFYVVVLTAVVVRSNPYLRRLITWARNTARSPRRPVSVASAE